MKKFREYIKSISYIEKKVNEERDLYREHVLLEVRYAIDAFDLTHEELFPRDKKSRKAEARYINPETGVTWSGRGREPHWIRGKDRRQYELRESTLNGKSKIFDIK
ncbi:H-NS histone family protein [Burkholderia cepacia]|uniref:H-NS histone family protein n=1 Tax=Burkholderia cepacia TaxID=292 RepID=UPI002AB7205C|nr:H-NS histone family protein [Burkholderia cepacia]